jgi:alcohol dehydrogenase class IV
MNQLTEQTYTFHFPTSIRFGNGVIAELGPHLKDQGYTSPLLVTDPGLAKLPLLKHICNALNKAGVNVELFTDIHKNPVKSDVLKGEASYKKAHCDSIIGLGGGASMDVARAIALKINHPRDLFDYVELTGGDQYITQTIPYFVTAPTTSGTGSEVGRSAVISDDDTHQKKILFHPTLLARAVFADPTLTFDLPAGITAATGMDALTHNIEAYLSRGFHPLCDGIALEGIRLIHESLEHAVKNPTPESRTKMMAGALMGAVAFQKGLGLIHSMAHALSTHKDLHHGLANALMMPAGLRFNMNSVSNKIHSIEKHIEIDQPLSDYILNLTKKIGLPTNLFSQGISVSDIDILAKLAYADGCHQCNEVTVTEEDFKNLFKETLH